MWDSYKDEDREDAISMTSQDSGMRLASHTHTENYIVRSDDDESLKPQTHSDKLIELMSFRSLFHMGQIQIGLAKADRLKQGK